ncbi:32271_t:CDS:2, partial [Gigaspora margarita]
PSKKKLPPNMLPDGTRFDKATSLNLLPSDESGPSLILVNDDEDDENDNVPDPNEIPDLSPSGPQVWSLPSGKYVEDIFAANAFMTKNYETLLTTPELPDEVDTFILEIKKMVHQGNSNAAFKLCIENYASSPINSDISKFSKIYSDFFYKTIDGNDMLECDSIEHTEVDIIIKAFLYIIDGGKSFCPLSKSTSYTKGRKCDVCFLSSSGMDLGEWEFSVRATTDKTISDRCCSGRINQSILNGLLRLDWKDEQIQLIKVPFIQFAGINGQMLIEVLVNGFYIIFPGPKFQLPTLLAQIEKLKSTVKVTKYIM